MKTKLLTFLNTKKAFCFFLVLSAGSSLSTFVYGHIVGFSDEGHYWSLAQGMHQGKFSAWYFLPFDTPETLRTWGYPFFLYLCQFFSDSYWLPQIAQLIIFGISIYCILKLIRHFYKPLAYRTVFLICLVFNNHLCFYSGVLIAESLTLFFVTLFATVYILQKESYKKYLLLALICFALFQLRPIFLAFPLFLFLYVLIFNRSRLKYSTVLLGVYLLSLIPFGMWNKANHGIFKVTPLEGGYGAALQSGYWEFRLPIGFSAPYYWGMEMDDDLLQPSFISENKKTEAAKIYVQDWETILTTLRSKYATRDDSLREIMMRDPAYDPTGGGRRNFIIYSAQYTLAREDMLKEKFLGYVKADPVFYFKTRVYTFFRQWVTGINGTQLASAKNIKGYMVALYPFLITFVFILNGLFLICMQLWRKKISWKPFHIFYLFIGYIATVDIPFGVMSRYTVPVHLFILTLVSIVIVNGLNKTSTA